MRGQKTNVTAAFNYSKGVVRGANMWMRVQLVCNSVLQVPPFGVLTMSKSPRRYRRRSGPLHGCFRSHVVDNPPGRSPTYEAAPSQTPESTGDGVNVFRETPSPAVGGGVADVAAADRRVDTGPPDLAVDDVRHWQRYRIL